MADIKQLIKTAAALRDALIKQANNSAYPNARQRVHIPSSLQSTVPVPDPSSLPEPPPQHMLSDVYDYGMPISAGAGGLGVAGGFGAQYVLRQRAGDMHKALRPGGAQHEAYTQAVKNKIDARKPLDAVETRLKNVQNAASLSSNAVPDPSLLNERNKLVAEYKASPEVAAYKKFSDPIRRNFRNARLGGTVGRYSGWGGLAALGATGAAGLIGSQFDNARQKNYLQALQQRIQQAQQSGSKQSSDTYVDHLTKLAGALRGFC